MPAQIFSGFGALAYELLTYQRPFAADTLGSFLSQVLETGLEPSDERLKGLPYGIRELIARCLERDPADRYRNFDPLLAELKPILERERSRERLAAEDQLPQNQSAGGEDTHDGASGKALTNEDTQEDSSWDSPGVRRQGQAARSGSDDSLRRQSRKVRDSEGPQNPKRRHSWLPGGF